MFKETLKTGKHFTELFSTKNENLALRKYLIGVLNLYYKNDLILCSHGIFFPLKNMLCIPDRNPRKHLEFCHAFHFVLDMDSTMFQAAD